MELSDAAIGAILATGAILLCALLLVALVLAWLSALAGRHRKLWLEQDDDGEVRGGLELRAAKKPKGPFPWSEDERPVDPGQIDPGYRGVGLDGKSP